MIAVNYLLYHPFDADLLVKIPLVSLAVTNFVEAKRPWFLIPGIIFECD